MATLYVQVIEQQRRYCCQPLCNVLSTSHHLNSVKVKASFWPYMLLAMDWPLAAADAALTPDAAWARSDSPGLSPRLDPRRFLSCRHPQTPPTISSRLTPTTAAATMMTVVLTPDPPDWASAAASLPPPDTPARNSVGHR